MAATSPSRVLLTCGVLLLVGCAGAGSRGSPQLPSPKAAASATDLPVTLDIQLVDSADPALRMTLVNHSDQILRIPLSELPWRQGWGMALAAVARANPGTPLEQFYRIDDLSVEEEVLRPGGSLSGSVFLTQRFPDLRQVRQTSDVLVRWKYEWTGRGQPPIRLRGCVVVPRLGSNRSASPQGC